ncbi:uncharacterized protein CLUP02_14076 [Colletotrichum lupini]|uniref:Uncharacterized protein n=1 Tax=Colletotrichum lupini TaxID=145971 RepID=A0A9Q8WMD1_9PEZI|nr:uncharacterized protein CLUP02_14076 [Colletotrichum lupini]UQC88551.1 hypothetical protein CLUP02_14076 [Colletotrichum lupini]
MITDAGFSFLHLRLLKVFGKRRALTYEYCLASDNVMKHDFERSILKNTNLRIHPPPFRVLNAPSSYRSRGVRSAC